MAKEEKLGSVKRFGTRYGRSLKQKLAKIEVEQKKLQKCPYCNAMKVKRVAMGIWKCKRCGAKFSGNAYFLTKKIIVEEKA